MPHPSGLITLLTDFGDRDWFVASMKGAILSIHPDARIVDLSHQIAPHRIDEARYFLKSCYREFPDGTIRPGVLVRSKNGAEVWLPQENMEKVLVSASSLQ